MRKQNYAMRRGVSSSFARSSARFSGNTAGWGRNRNTVRHLPKNLGSFSSFVIIGMLVLVVGLIYVTQGTKTSNYDYELSAIEHDIAEMSAKKDDLALEQARLTSIAHSENSEVAKAMKDSKIAEYVAE